MTSGACFTKGEDLKEMIGKPVPINVYTDSKSVFDVISKGTRTSEKIIMLDLHSSRESFNKQDIRNIAFVRSKNNLADAFTKRMKKGFLMHVLYKSTLEFPA